MSDSFPKSIELKKRSLHERIIVAKVLLESVLDELPSVQLELEKNSPKLDNENGELISRQAAIDAALTFFVEFLGGAFHEDDQRKLIALYEQLPSVQPEDWMERNKERILQAGMEGREIEFRIGGRLFAIREKAQ